MTKTHSAETYIVDRYQRLWGRWKPNYRYKHLKGERIAQIVRDTGGLAPIALELGVGPGGVAAAVSRAGTKVVGLDLSPDALAKAREHCRTENVVLMRGSGFSLPFADGTFPLVYASQVLHLFDSEGRLAIMREVHRVLKPGGRFVFDMKNASSHLLKVSKYSEARRRKNFPGAVEISGLLQETGFAAVTLHPGVLPLVPVTRIPEHALFRRVAHSTFFVASRS